MSNRLRPLAVLTALLLVSGCAATPAPPSWTPRPPAVRPQPAPYPLPPPAPRPLPPSGPVLQPSPGPALPGPLEPAAPPPLALPPAPPSSNSAVVALLQKAQNQSSAGQLEAASASLERALRIEPRNPALWQQLARVRLEQKDYPQAENLAAKANALAGNDRRLRAENWRIIGQARTLRGDRAGAKAAFERAEREQSY